MLWPLLITTAALATAVSASSKVSSSSHQFERVIRGSNVSLAPSQDRLSSGLHLGVDYYPAQWPEFLWESDVAGMRDLNVSYVRINEFDWGILEPEEGVYNFSVLDDTLELFGRYGLKAILGTPTASPPDWLTKKYDISFVDVTNSTYVFGSRRYYSFSSFDYREQSQKITRVLAERYGSNPNVVAWQLDNEFGCHSTVRSYDKDAITRFRTWLQQKYGTIEAMNAAQGRVFWSNQYASFDDVLPPYHEVYTTNDLYTLDWYTFSSDMVIEFAQEQAAILREYAPTQAVTTNFMVVFTDFDHYKFAREVGIDIAYFDNYPLAGPSDFTWVTDDQLADTLRTGLPDLQALQHAVYRGVAGAAYGQTAGPFGVMEMQPGMLNWNTYRVSPLEGMVRLWTLETYAASGDVVSYFRWRQVPYAQEQTLSGLHISDGSDDEGFFEAQDVAFNDLPILREKLGQSNGSSSAAEAVAHEPQADVALIFDYSSVWTWAIEPYSGSWDVTSATYTGTVLSNLDLVYTFFSALRRLGLSVDVIGPDQDLSAYKMVVVPSIPIIPAALNASLASYTAGPVVFGPRSAALTANFSYAPGIQPAAGALRDHLPMRVTRIETPPSYANSSVSYAGTSYAITYWEEWVSCSRGNASSNATVTSGSKHRLGKPAACASVDQDEGKQWHYLGFNPPADFLVSYLGDMAAAAGLSDLTGKAASKDADLGSSLRLLRRGDLLWAFNYGAEAVAAPAVDSTAQLVIGEAGDIPAAGVVVWKLSS
ncbi:family 42 glycoside hydrolase [Cryphonectria parasitica EP155]|uniref:beta-galactosidase n=1 Tax=Cryphonectria parasitica (strain ATCC 38755 / EP155) TaxID=660469 RepID=A0A9P4Y602_CRYP1|nr:family 42 glycoside hydrolase [Cryphonectria parasitica EP155]KAF3767341.1 family 42 glycoside hydrolase [Cryphonectria parasitica EP155]